MPAILDRVFEFVGTRVTPRRSSTRFFCDGWGDLALARDVTRRARAYMKREDASKIEPHDARLFEAVRDVNIVWGPETRAEKGYGVNVRRWDATFASPMADALPEESKTVRFARLRRAATRLDDDDDARDKKRRIAVLLPCTGDMYEWFRRGIARELLAEGVDCVIPTIAYYGERKPANQWRHVLTTVADAKIQLSVTPIEMVALTRALKTEAEREGYAAEFCLAGVSLGGTMSSLTACALASEREVPASALSVCCVAGAADCYPYVEGSIETRLSWDVLCEAAEEGGGKLVTPLTKTRAKERLLEVMEDLDMTRLLVENSVNAAVCLTADQDRFVGPRANAKVPATLQKMLSNGKKVWREEFRGGHLSFLFGHKHVIAPSIKRAFDMLDQS